MTRGAAALLAALFAVLLLGSLTIRPLYKADESRYAEIPREMVASGDWLTPRLNDLKYFYKPPLQYWATAAMYAVFGERDAVARLWMGLTALGTLILVFYAGNRAFGPPTGTYGALILAGSPLFVLLSQINTLDMALSFFLTAAIFAFALGRYYLFWAACALAVLSKGLIGIVLPVGAVALYLLIKRDFILLKKIRVMKGGLLFLAISAPWFIAVSLANPEFFDFFFVQEHFQRFTTKIHARYKPFWYFIPIVLGGMAPWLLLVFTFRKVRLERREFDPALFLLVWIAVVFLFFSASSSKLPSYVLPILPAAALLLGRWTSLAQPRRLLAAQAGLVALAGIGLAVLSVRIPLRMGLTPEAPASYAAWLTAAGAVLAALGLAAAAFAWRARTGPAIAALSLAAFAATLIALAGHRTLAPVYSIGGQVAQLGERFPPREARIYAVDFYDHTLPWYFRRPVTMVRYQDELVKAIAWEPGKFLPKLQDFEKAWAAERGAYAVIASPDVEKLKKEIDFPMEVLSQGPRYTIVRKP